MNDREFQIFLTLLQKIDDPLTMAQMISYANLDYKFSDIMRFFTENFKKGTNK